MLGRAYNTMKDKDSFTTAGIKVMKRGEDDWQGAGPDALWQKIYTELDRLEVCRGPQIVQIVDDTPGKEQLNAGQTATITVGTVRDHDGDSSTPDGIVEGEYAEFTVTLDPAPSSPQRVRLAIYGGQSSDSSFPRNAEYSYRANGWTGAMHFTIPTTGMITIRAPTVDDHTDEPDAQVWLWLAEDDTLTMLTRVNVYDNDDPVPQADR